MLMKMIALMRGEARAAKETANMASSGTEVRVITGDYHLVKVSKVRGQSRVTNTVARSQC